MNSKGSLPPTQSTFLVDLEGDLTKQSYYGEFTCKIMNHKDKAFVAKHRAFLDGGFSEDLDIFTVNLHYIVAYLKFALTTYPDWWKDSDLGYELYDFNVIKHIYDQVLAFEDEWYKEVWGEDSLKEMRSSDSETGD